MKGRAIDMTEKQQASWEERDLAHIWHPCSQMKDYETLPPMVIDHAKGPWLYDIHGKKYLDIVSSWWANLLGHCNPEINEAIKEQLDSLEHVRISRTVRPSSSPSASQRSRQTASTSSISTTTARRLSKPRSRCASSSTTRRASPRSSASCA